MKNLDAQRRDFVNRLVRLKHEAFQLGFLRTGHRLDLATTEVGYEWADIKQKIQVDLDLRAGKVLDLQTGRMVKPTRPQAGKPKTPKPKRKPR